MSELRCQSCGHLFAEGESAWADDWKVIDTSGTTVTFRMETRYTCDWCAQ